MNKTFTRFFAGALAAASLFALASCGKKKEGDDKSANASTPAPITEAPSVTDEPTAAPTEAPTPEPTETPEPTATPIPEGWIIDPEGIIPPEVEIVVLVDKPGCCITTVDGQAVFQKWTKSGLKQEWVVPSQLLTAFDTSCYLGKYQAGDIEILAGITEDFFGPFMYYYQDKEGHTLFFEVGSMFGSPNRLLLATLDGKIIYYIWGNDFYQMHDFGPEAKVEVTANADIVVNGKEAFGPEELSWINIPI